MENLYAQITHYMKLMLRITSIQSLMSITKYQYR
jgi:hypothetical protein